MPPRLHTYAASLLVDWYGGKTGRDYRLESADDGDPPVFVARCADGMLALAVAELWEPESDAAAEGARQFMEERLSAGLVRGPFVFWVPPRARIPSEEPDASDFVQRVQQAAAPLSPGERGEVELPVTLGLGKVRDEGGYASVVGGLSRWWTLITERVSGTFSVNSAAMRRAPQSSERRETLFTRIAELSRTLNTGEATQFESVEAWTVQRMREEPLGETGFAIAQAPPGVEPAEGTIMRRVVRKRLRAAAEALDGVAADVKGCGLIAIYDYAENENVGSFVKSLDPGVFAKLPLIAALVDGEVRPIFLPR
jgi:hypothetical protein